MSEKLPRLQAEFQRETFRPSRTIGFISAARDWGTIAKCPHCPKTDIRRKAKAQITCGSPKCRSLQNHKKRPASKLKRLEPFREGNEVQGQKDNESHAEDPAKRTEGI